MHIDAQRAWRNAAPASPCNPGEFRKDPCGAWIRLDDYANHALDDVYDEFPLDFAWGVYIDGAGRAIAYHWQNGPAICSITAGGAGGLENVDVPKRSQPPKSPVRRNLLS